MVIEPANYGFTQEEFKRIREEVEYKGDGLIVYAKRGQGLTPIKMMRNDQLRLKVLFDQSPIKITNVTSYDINSAFGKQQFL